MGKNKNFKLMDFLHILGEAEIHTIPKIWENWIYIIQEKDGKIQKFQIHGFVKYFRLNRNPYNSQNREKWIPTIREEYGKKTDILNLWIS